MLENIKILKNTGKINFNGRMMEKLLFTKEEKYIF